jgi:hypothetical protein
MRMKREPLTSIVTPARDSPATRAASASTLAKCSPPSPNALTASRASSPAANSRAIPLVLACAPISR